ncbi:MAG: Holliday junction resolvase-like protein [Candidatus Aenigmatarchaeota archaeon]
MILEFIAIFLLILVLYLWIKNKEWELKFERRIEDFLRKEEDRIREDAIKRSARALSGRVLEKLVPFLKNFNYNPHDIRWIGDPIDLVIFDGYSEKEFKQIVFCEVKSGESKLNESQKEIKKLIESKKIKWEEFRI